MAAEGKLDVNKNTTNDVITLSSDEEATVNSEDESSEDVGYLFDRFILACRKFVDKESLGIARDAFKTTPRDHACSKTIRAKLRRSTGLVTKDNASALMENVCKSLNSEKLAAKVQNGLTVASSNTSRSEMGEARGEGADVINAPNFEGIMNSNTIENGVDKVTEISDDDDGNGFVQEKKKHGKSSKSDGDESKLPIKDGKIATRTLSDKQRKKIAMKLQLRLKQLSQEIKILNKAELTLDEMEMADSLYMKENRLKKRFDKTWNKLCRVLGRPPKTGRVVEKPVHPTKTGNTIIDKAIETFLKDKQGKFPNYFDIRDVVEETNKQHDLRMSPQVMKDIIRDVFTDVGNKMQKLRQKDLLFNFGSHLLDDFKTEEDPALKDGELLQQLEQNKKISKRNLRRVYSKYTRLERFGDHYKKGKRTERNSNDDNESEDTTPTDNETDSDKANSPPSSPAVSSDKPSTSFATSTCTSKNSTQRVVQYVSLIDEDESVDSSTLSQSNEMVSKECDKASSQDTVGSLMCVNSINADNLGESSAVLTDETITSKQEIVEAEAIDINNSMDNKAPHDIVMSETTETVENKHATEETADVATSSDSCMDTNIKTESETVLHDSKNSELHTNISQAETSGSGDDDCCIIEKPEKKLDVVNKICSNKRKRPGDLCEKIVSALKLKKLKVPGSWAEKNTSDIPVETQEKLAIFHKIFCNGHSPKLGEPSNHSQSTVNTTEKVQGDLTDNKEICSHVDNNVDLPKQSVPVRNGLLKQLNNRQECNTPATGTCTSDASHIEQNTNQKNGEKPDIIIIDD